MTNPISVICVIDRCWKPEDKNLEGTPIAGTLIAVSAQSDSAYSDKHSPVGIVLLDDGTFESVPLEFITKQIN